jgi:hypothetical protein
MDAIYKSASSTCHNELFFSSYHGRRDVMGRAGSSWLLGVFVLYFESGNGVLILGVRFVARKVHKWCQQFFLAVISMTQVRRALDTPRV